MASLADYEPGNLAYVTSIGGNFEKMSASNWVRVARPELVWPGKFGNLLG